MVKTANYPKIKKNTIISYIFNKITCNNSENNVKTGADMALMMSLDELSLEPMMGMREDYYKFIIKARIMYVNGITGKVTKDRVNDEEMVEYPIIVRSDYTHDEFRNTVIRELKKVAKF